MIRAKGLLGTFFGDEDSDNDIPPLPPETFFILQEDGTSRILEEDGTDRLLLEAAP